MMHFLRRLAAPLPLIAAATVATFITAAPADARPKVRGVKTTVTVRSTTAWSLQAQLARGTTLGKVTGATARRRGRAFTLTGNGTRTLTVVTKGARKPTAWRVGSKACAVRPAKRRGTTARLTVSCVPAPSGGTPAVGGTTPAPGSAPAGAGDGPAAYRFAPYADLSGWPVPDLATIRQGSGVDRISLGFVVKNTAGACDPTWGGFDVYPATGANAYQRAQILAFRQGGGDVVVSFGGAAGTELALVCDSVTDLAAAYRAVIDAYGVAHLDFDIEGAAINDTAANTRRAQAIAKLQQADPALVVTYTLPAETSGLIASGLAVIDDAVKHGVDIAAVNIMAMNFSGVGDSTGKMGTFAIQAGTALHGQLATFYPALSAQQRWRKVGVTPMIGVNDFADQVFTVQDARDVAAWAGTQHIGMLGMWSLGRDEGENWAFSNAFKTFTN